MFRGKCKMFDDQKDDHISEYYTNDRISCMLLKLKCAETKKLL